MRPGAVASDPLLRQLLACGLLLLPSARLPSRLAALAVALARPLGPASKAVGAALAMLGFDGYGVPCALHLSHARSPGVPLLHRCCAAVHPGGCPLCRRPTWDCRGLLTLVRPDGASGL